MEIISQMTSVFMAVFEWLGTALSTVLGIFYINGELTVLGVIILIGVSIAIFMLVMNIIIDFFRLR